MITSIPIKRKNNLKDVFLSHALNHRVRRSRRQTQKKTVSDRTTAKDMMGGRGLDASEEMAFSLSNCHSVLWTGTIGLGTPSVRSGVHGQIA